MCASYSKLYEEGEGGVSQRPTLETFSGPHPKELVTNTFMHSYDIIINADYLLK